MRLSKSVGDMLQEFAGRQVGTFPFFDIIDALPAVIYTTDANGKIDLYNKAAVEMWGREPDCDDERWCGSWKLFYPDGRPMPHDTCPMAEALKTGCPIRGREAIAEKPDGTRVNFIPYPTPIKDEAGKVVGAINMLVDITERKRSEEALASSEAKLRDFVESTTIGLHWVGPDGIIIWANRAEMDMLGYTAEEYIGQPIAKFHADEHVITDILERLARFETLRDHEARLRCKDGSIRHVLIDSSVYVEYAKVLQLRPQGDMLLRAGVGWRKGLVGKSTVSSSQESQAGYTLYAGKPVVVENLKEEKRFSGPRLLHDHGVVSGLSTIISGEDERVFGVLGAYTKKRRSVTAHDVHFLQSVSNILATAIQKKSNQDAQVMLRRELAHRVKNNLMVVQAIARMAAQYSDSTEKFIESFEGRLAALAQAHDILIKSDWAGTSLANLHRLVLGSQTARKRVRFDIEDLKLDAEATQAMTMVIYELMTNASKHGALSNDSGTIHITGKHDLAGGTPVYRFTWQECGGPPLQKPRRRGHGSKLITWTVEKKCGGKLDVDWRRKGLLVDITLPLDTIT